LKTAQAVLVYIAEEKKVFKEEKKWFHVLTELANHFEFHKEELKKIEKKEKKEKN
jgi:hypothetical protein